MDLFLVQDVRGVDPDVFLGTPQHFMQTRNLIAVCRGVNRKKWEPQRDEMASAISFCESPSYYGETWGSTPHRSVLREALFRKVVLQTKSLHYNSAVSLRQNLFERSAAAMQIFTVIVGAIVAWIGILYLISRYSIIIFEFERGLKYRKGKFAGVLTAGRYWILSRSTTVNKIDVRPRFITVPGQEVLSADSVTLKVSVTARYEITDPNLAVNKIENYIEAFYAIVQLAIRDIIGSMKIDEILEQRSTLNQKLMELTTSKAEEFGIKIQLIGIKDIMFPGELKKIFAKVVEAQKEGLAALERARGETAALRNLANVAKVLEDNPALMQLRAIQSTGNTVVIGVGGSVVPVKGKKDD